MNLSTEDENLSPAIDTMNGTVIYVRNRLNKPVVNYTTDNRVHANNNDPHAAVYISNRVNIKQPATSIKLLVSSDRRDSADFRALIYLKTLEDQMR